MHCKERREKSFKVNRTSKEGQGTRARSRVLTDGGKQQSQCVFFMQRKKPDPKGRKKKNLARERKKNPSSFFLGKRENKLKQSRSECVRGMIIRRRARPKTDKPDVHWHG